jgi:hypothetical protein
VSAIVRNNNSMNSELKFLLISFRKTMIAIVVITGLFACSKSKNDPPNPLTYCGTINWINQIGMSGYFTGSVAGSNFYLKKTNYNDGTEKITEYHRDSKNHILNDQSSIFSVTYVQDNITRMVMGSGNSTIAFSFDMLSHLTSTQVITTEISNSTNLILNYSYDTNGDPVTITGHGTNTSASGTATSDYTITADYLADRNNFIPPLPEITPFTTYFAYSWFLSKHLINKWQIHITGISADGTPFTLNFTQQYTYTFDTNGRVLTMVHTGNSNNKFTFSYTGCN